MGSSQPYRFVTTAVYQSRRAGVRVRRARQLPEVRDSAVAPVPALVAARTELGLLDLVVAGDWLLRAKLASLDEVRQALADASGRHCRRARRAGELVRKGSESPRETRLRLLIVLCGLPEPECNIDLGDEWFFIGRVDLYLRAWNIGVEYEGDQHRSDAKVFGNDLDSQLRATGGSRGAGDPGVEGAPSTAAGSRRAGSMPHWSRAATTARRRSSGPSGAPRSNRAAEDASKGDPVLFRQAAKVHLVTFRRDGGGVRRASGGQWGSVSRRRARTLARPPALPGRVTGGADLVLPPQLGVDDDLALVGRRPAGRPARRAPAGARAVR